MRAAIIGAGSFGTALSYVLGGKGIEVRLWDRQPELCEGINREHRNPRYLSHARLPETVRASASFEEVLDGAEMVVAATPSQFAREVFAKAQPFLPRDVPIVSAAKGIEEETLLVPTAVLEDVLEPHFHPYLAVLSGPSFAREIVDGAPTAVTVAAIWPRVAERVQEAFTAQTFRCYTSPDVVGVQLGGALKNVIAIGCGIIDGLGFGANARAALITRGLTEISRLAVAQGANPITLMGLAGLGDLVLTCTGELSRNRTVGYELGRGRKLPEILEALGQVAEGVKTSRSALALARRLGVDAPITEQVHSILYEDKDPQRTVVELMTRVPKPEFR